MAKAKKKAAKARKPVKAKLKAKLKPGPVAFPMVLAIMEEPPDTLAVEIELNEQRLAELRLVQDKPRTFLQKLAQFFS